MRSKFAHQYLEQERGLEEQHQNHYQRSKFLPMLCSSSSTPKQVVIKLIGQRHRRCSSTSSTVSDEPLSPRVGCMGQVKRNHKVVFPASRNKINTTTKNDQICSNYTSNSIVKYYKLKRFFSSKSLTGSPTTTIVAAATTVTRNGTHKGKTRSVAPKGARTNTARHDHLSRKSRSKTDEKYAGNITASNNKNNENEVKDCLVNLVDLDPPLPVVKQLGNINRESVSLWKRRSGGTPLKSLDVKAIPESCNLLVQATTV